MDETARKRVLVGILVLLIMIAGVIFIVIQLEQGSQAPEDTSAATTDWSCGEKSCPAGTHQECLPNDQCHAQGTQLCRCKSDYCDGAGCSCNQDSDCATNYKCVYVGSDKECQGIGGGCSAYVIPETNGNQCIRFLGNDCTSMSQVYGESTRWPVWEQDNGRSQQVTFGSISGGNDITICADRPKCYCSQIDAAGAVGGGGHIGCNGTVEECTNLQCNSQCDANAQCSTGYCYNGRCRDRSCPAEQDCTCDVNVTCNQTCDADRKCSDGTSCINGRCRNPECPSTSSCVCIKDVTCNQDCDANNQCSDQTTCIDGKCRNEECPSETDCICATCGDGKVDPGEECDPLAEESTCHLGTTCQDDCTCLSDAGCGEGCTEDTDCPDNHTCVDGVCTLNVCLEPGACDGPCDPIFYPDLPETALISDTADKVLFGVLMVLLAVIAVRFDVQNKLFLAWKSRLADITFSSDGLVISKRKQRSEFEDEMRKD